MKIAKEIGGKYGESTCYIYLGIAYQSLGDYTKAIEYYEKALVLKMGLKIKMENQAAIQI